MTRDERKEYIEIRNNLLKSDPNSFIMLTIRTDASASYKNALNDLYNKLDFHPCSVRTDPDFNDNKERIVYIRGIETNGIHWTKLYSKIELDLFRAKLDEEPPKPPRAKPLPNETRYFVTDVVDVPVIRIGKLTEAYKYSLKAGWGYTEEDPNSGALLCCEDKTIDIYDTSGNSYCFSSYDEIDVSKLPKQYNIAAIITSDECGFTFWEREPDTVKFFVSYDSSGLIDTYRLDANPTLFDGEEVINFNDLIASKVIFTFDRADIYGTVQYSQYHQPCTQYHTLEDLKCMSHAADEEKKQQKPKTKSSDREL